MYRLVYYRYFMNFSESINFKSISTVSNNIKSNGFHKNAIKPNNYGLKNDTVEINKNDSSQNDSKKSKLLKWGAIVGCAIAATTIGVLAKKKITAKNAKKSAEELEKLKRQELERVRAEELKKAEEARIAKEQALKAQHEAREKAVQEAKAKAEQEAKIKAEKEAEAARIAQEKAENKIKDDLFKDFDEQLGAEKLKSHISYNDEINQPNVFENGIVNTLKKAEDKGISQDKIENLYQTIAEKNSLNDTQIKGISGSSNLLPYESDFAKYELRSRRQLFDGVETLKVELPAVLCMLKCDYEPRRPLINGFKLAQNSEIPFYSHEDIGIEPEAVGLKGSPTCVSKAFRPKQKTCGEIFENISADNAVEKILEVLNG